MGDRRDTPALRINSVAYGLGSKNMYRNDLQKTLRGGD